MVLNCQPFFERCSRNISNFVPRKLTWRPQNISCNWNEPWPKHKHLMVNLKLRKAKGQYTKNRTANVRMSWTVYTDLLHTISHFPVLLSLFLDNYCCCWDSDFVQLFNMVFHSTSRARQATMIMKTAPASPFIGDITRGKSWKIKLVQKPVAFEQRFTRWKVSYRRHIAYLICIMLDC